MGVLLTDNVGTFLDGDGAGVTSCTSTNITCHCHAGDTFRDGATVTIISASNCFSKFSSSCNCGDNAATQSNVTYN